MCVRAQVYDCSIITTVVAAPHRSSYYNNSAIVFVTTLPLYSFPKNWAPRFFVLFATFYVVA